LSFFTTITTQPGAISVNRLGISSSRLFDSFLSCLFCPKEVVSTKTEIIKTESDLIILELLESVQWHNTQRSGLAAGLAFEKRQTVTKADKVV
jgi:hypothetical protein